MRPPLPLTRLLLAWIIIVQVIATGAAIAGSGIGDRTAAAGTEDPEPVATTAPARPPSTTTTTVPERATTTTAATQTDPAPATAHSVSPGASTSGAILLAWTYGALPAGYGAAISNVPAVTGHTIVMGDVIRLIATRAVDGAAVDEAPPWWAYPIDALAIDPAGFASFVEGPDRDVLAALRPGSAVLTESSAEIRRLGPGGLLTFAGGQDVVVSGIVADRSGSGAEILVHRDDADRLDIDTARFALIRDNDRAVVEAQLRAMTPASKRLTLRGSNDANWLRHGDRVDPQVLVKKSFGEFSFHDGDPGHRDIRIDQAWIDAHIVSTTVPLLGEIRCHRRIVALVRAAMEELERAGRADVIDRGGYAGCFHPRRIAAGAGLSRHSWGIAMDLNIRADPRGSYETQDDALVRALTSRGFYWGGDWPNFPDPGHYEKQADQLPG